MARSIKGQKIIARIPRERCLVETDGPYVRMRGRVAEPRDVWHVIDYLAQQWHLARTAAAGLVEENVARLVAGL